MNEQAAGMSGMFNPKGMAEWFRRRAERYPDAPALSFEGETWTYRRFQEEVENLAAVLASVGVAAGARVGYLGFNHPMTLFTLFAANRIGAIFIPLNFRLSPRETKQCVDDAGIHTIIADEHHQHLIEEVRGTLGCTNYIAASAGGHAGWTLLDDLRAADPAPAGRVDGAPDDVAVLLFTSGTTGRAKGAMLTNENFWVNSINWLLSSDYGSGDVALNVAPLFHAGGLNAIVTPMLLAGGHVVLQKAFDPAGFIRAIEEFRVSVTFMVPAMMLAASQNEAFGSTDLSSLRLIVAGGAPVPEPMLRLFGDRGIPVSNCYGMTEATSAVTFLETASAIRKLGSCGRAGMLCDVRVVDADEKEVAEPMVRGEIRMRGGNIVRGYWNLPKESAEAVDAEGWLRSGDIGYFDADGYFYICDRLKDMIISGGENIYPAELESVIYEHPAIAEVAIIGAPDETWGERVVAVAALKPGRQLTLEALQAFAEGKMARYKMPRALHIVEALPRNGNGKVIKTELRQRFGSAKP